MNCQLKGNLFEKLRASSASHAIQFAAIYEANPLQLLAPSEAPSLILTKGRFARGSQKITCTIVRSCFRAYKHKDMRVVFRRSKPMCRRYAPQKSDSIPSNA